MKNHVKLACTGDHLPVTVNSSAAEKIVAAETRHLRWIEIFERREGGLDLRLFTSNSHGGKFDIVRGNAHGVYTFTDS